MEPLFTIEQRLINMGASHVCEGLPGDTPGAGHQAGQRDECCPTAAADKGSKQRSLDSSTLVTGDAAVELSMVSAIADSVCAAYAKGYMPVGTQHVLAALFPTFSYLSLSCCWKSDAAQEEGCPGVLVTASNLLEPGSLLLAFDSWDNTAVGKTLTTQQPLVLPSPFDELYDLCAPALAGCCQCVCLPFEMVAPAGSASSSAGRKAWAALICGVQLGYQASDRDKTLLNTLGELCTRGLPGAAAELFASLDNDVSSASALDESSGTSSSEQWGGAGTDNDWGWDTDSDDYVDYAAEYAAEEDAEYEDGGADAAGSVGSASGLRALQGVSGPERAARAMQGCRQWRPDDGKGGGSGCSPALSVGPSTPGSSSDEEADPLAAERAHRPPEEEVAGLAPAKHADAASEAGGMQAWTGEGSDSLPADGKSQEDGCCGSSGGGADTAGSSGSGIAGSSSASATAVWGAGFEMGEQEGFGFSSDGDDSMHGSSKQGLAPNGEQAHLQMQLPRCSLGLWFPAEWAEEAYLRHWQFSRHALDALITPLMMMVEVVVMYSAGNAWVPPPLAMVVALSTLTWLRLVAPAWRPCTRERLFLVQQMCCGLLTVLSMVLTSSDKTGEAAKAAAHGSAGFAGIENTGGNIDWKATLTAWHMSGAAVMFHITLLYQVRWHKQLLVRIVCLGLQLLAKAMLGPQVGGLSMRAMLVSAVTSFALQQVLLYTLEWNSRARFLKLLAAHQERAGRPLSATTPPPLPGLVAPLAPAWARLEAEQGPMLSAGSE